MFAPRIIPIACLSDKKPALTRPIVMAVVPELLWIKAVTAIPAITPLIGLEVMRFKISLKRSPAAA